MGGSTAARRVPLPEGVEIREGSRGSSLRIMFIWQGKRRRETLDVPATPANIKYAARLRGEIQNAIARGTFDYAATFPNSKLARSMVPAERKRYLISDLLDKQLDTARKLQSLSPSTIASYTRWARSRIIPKWGQNYIDEITTLELRDWIVGMSASMAPKSVRNCVGLLSVTLSQAVADGIITTNPLEPIKLRTLLPRKRRSEDDSIDPFNDEEIAQILKAADAEEVRALWMFAFATGLRTGELIAVKWRHVLEGRGVIRVEDNIVSTDEGVVEKATKTDTVREVPLLPAAVEALEIMKGITMASGANGYIFINPNTRRRWASERVMRKHWAATLGATALRYRNQYQTRHTFASRLLMAGEPELLVAKLLGHVTVEMVRRHYGRYITQPNGIVLKGDYSGFGTDPEGKAG
ncbi:Arm DNA-binding domain-containing protein [Chromobacterium subtsugae]|uniref:Arm DNA-binding domain-containing protein n=1 Tax=Chromobacterium subtsugae TaxID=251747 RepID=UPI0009BF09FA|nr:DUF3596 domain-containing protein [Chromobacterium subtsugae]